LHFTFVGSFDPAKLKAYILQYIGSLPATPVEHKAVDVGLRTIRGQHDLRVNRGADQKSLVSIVYSGETPYSRQEDLKARALTEVMNIRIIEQLREQMSGIYGGGMGGGLLKRSYPAYNLSVNFPCGPENVDTLTKALYAIIASVQEKGCTDKELAKVKETWKKQYEEQVKTNNYWLEGLSTAWIEGEDPHALQTYLKEVEALTPADIQDAARKYLDPANRVKAVLYPAK
jgi:zinc protease